MTFFSNATKVTLGLFMFISGYLSKNITKSEFLSFFKKKSKRLLIPYFAITSLMAVSFGITDISIFCRGDFWTLWFLTALWWCLIISSTLDYSAKCVSIIAIIASLCMTLIVIPPIFGLHSFMKWFFFFALGAVFRYQPYINQIADKWYVIILLIIFYTLNFCIKTDIKAVDTIINTLTISAMVVVIWEIFQGFNVRNQTLIRSVITLGECSMGIYVIHYWLLCYILSSTSNRIFHLDAFASSHPVLILFTITIVAFVISFIIVYFTRKTRIGRIILG